MEISDDKVNSFENTKRQTPKMTFVFVLKGPLDLFCFQDKFVYLDGLLAIFGYNQRVALVTVRFLKFAGAF